MKENGSILWFEDIRAVDAPEVGRKNASLGEVRYGLKDQGVLVPDGFALTAESYRTLLQSNRLAPRIEALLAAYRDGTATLSETGRGIRRLFHHVTFPAYLAESIRAAYRALSARYEMEEVDVAVRSSATAEDLPEASFAGQLETFLNVVGEEELLEACRKCYASLYTDRAIAYREEQGLDHLDVALSVGVQKMVRADKAGSGVLFTIDTESGFPDVVLINAGWGLGENVVRGTINPDQYLVFKPLLDEPSYRPILEKKLGAKDKKLVYGNGDSKHTKNLSTPVAERRSFVLDDDEILRLARWGVAIERHYGRPMDVEWAKDGETGTLYIVQARPETVHIHPAPAALRTYTLKKEGRRLLTGLSIGNGIARGRVCRVFDAEDLDYVEEGCILVTAMTEPEWMPALQKVAGIVTEYGGRTCHAAIVSRELGIPAVVGTGEATQVLREGQTVTVSCAEGEQGYVYDGLLEYEVNEVNLDRVPTTRTRMMVNLTDPQQALKWWRLPVQGVGLARTEYIISHAVRVHPMALVAFDALKDERAQREIYRLTRGYADRTDYFVDQLAEGIAKIAASQYPQPVVVRTSDFKTDEYRQLIGGAAFEPVEENPAIGWRGAARYYSPRYREAFGLECRAIKKAREEIGLTNIVVMIPFCRTPAEADRVLEVMAEYGLKRGENGLEVHMLCEVPANVILAEAFAERFDGFSIGSNDLAQLVLGVDRSVPELSYLFDEQDEAVRLFVRDFIERMHRAGRWVGCCGQAPSHDLEFAAFLAESGIDALSLNPDRLVPVLERVAQQEQQENVRPAADPAPRRRARLAKAEARAK